MSLTPISYEEFQTGDLLTWSWIADEEVLKSIPEDKRTFIVLEDNGFDQLVVQMNSGKIVELNSVLREHLILLSRLS